MRFATYGQAYTLAVYLPSRPSAAGSATVKDASGATLLASPTVTLDTVNTTLSGAASAGATTLALTSATGVTVGRRYLVGGAESVGGETVTVTALSGTTATLARKLRRAQASGATFAGTRMTVALTSACTTTVQEGCRVEWTDPDTADVLVFDFDVVRWTPRTHLTIASLHTLDPLLSKRIPEGLWLPDLLDEAWDRLTDDLAAKGRVPGGVAGVINLTRAHGYLVRALIAEAGGRSAEEIAYLDDMRLRYQQDRDATLARLGYDADGDAGTEKGASVWRGIPLTRA